MNPKYKAVICDLDGTLQQVTEREKYIHSHEWDKFHAASVNEEPNLWCLEIVNRLKSDHEIFFLTGRKDSYREITEDWLLVKCDLSPNEYQLYMTPDETIALPFKKKIYLENIKPEYDVLFAIDDDDHICFMFKSLGITCLQVK
jgi:hydroxymethylpyrimidine pyrophosphatase-like HAD family hydrolase